MSYYANLTAARDRLERRMERRKAGAATAAVEQGWRVQEQARRKAERIAARQTKRDARKKARAAKLAAKRRKVAAREAAKHLKAQKRLLNQERRAKMVQFRANRIAEQKAARAARRPLPPLPY